MCLFFSLLRVRVSLPRVRVVLHLLVLLLVPFPEDEFREFVHFLAEHHTKAISVQLTLNQAGVVFLVEETDVLSATIVKSPLQSHVIDVCTRFTTSRAVI